MFLLLREEDCGSRGRLQLCCLELSLIRVNGFKSSVGGVCHRFGFGPGGNFENYYWKFLGIM